MSDMEENNSAGEHQEKKPTETNQKTEENRAESKKATEHNKTEENKGEDKKATEHNVTEYKDEKNMTHKSKDSKGKMKKDEANRSRDEIENLKTDNSKKDKDSLDKNSGKQNSQTPNVNTVKYTPLNRYDFDMKVIENWCEIRTKSTPKRRCHHTSFIHDDYLYVFGGIDINEGKLNDFSRISLTSDDPVWEQIISKGDIPEPIAYSEGVYHNRKYYLFCGENEKQQPVNNIYIYSLDTNTWEVKKYKETELPSVESHTIALYEKSETEGSIFSFGGYHKGHYINSLYEFNIEKGTSTKIDISKDVPSPEGRISHAMTIVGEDIYIYGGESSDGKYLSDLWKFSIPNKTWTSVVISGEPPKARSGHTMVTYKGNIFIFGGKTGNIHETNELWKLDVEKNKFELKHDTLLEQYSESEIKAMMANKAQSEELKKSPKNATNKRKTMVLSSVTTKDNKKNQTASTKQKYEDDLLKSPNSKAMKNSLIYKMEQNDTVILKSKVSTLLAKSVNLNRDVKIYQSVPIPRDGHSCNLYNNCMVIFGGDRNKFPLNDLFMFNLENSV